MKKLHLIATFTLAACFIGCGKKTTTEEVTSKPEKKPHVTSKPAASPAGQKQAAIRNSFWAVNQHLDQGGSFYLYLSTEQMLAKLDGYMDQITAMADLAGQELGEREKQQIAMAIDMGRTAYEQSGLRDISGFGASSFALESGLNRNVMVMHHYAEKQEGLIWKLVGGQAHEQEVLKLLPANTAFAFHADADVVASFNWVRDFLTNTAPPEVVAQFAQGLAQANQMFNFENLLKSTGGELGFFVTLNAQKRIPIPLPDAPAELKLDFPEPALAVVIKVKDDQLLKLITAQLQNPELAEMIKETREGDVTLYTMTTPPLPVEIDVSPTLMMSGNYLVLTSNTQLAKDILAVQSGKDKGLAGTAEFKRLAGDMDLKGNQLHFLSAEIGKEYGKLMEAVMKAAEAQAGELAGPSEKQMMELIKKLYIGDENTPASSQLGIVRVMGEGIVFESRNTGDGFGSTLIAGGVVSVGVGAALLLPALASARNKAREVQSMNNVKQLSIAMFAYEADTGALPIAAKWSDALLPFLGNNREVFISPMDSFAEGSSYAFNKQLSGVKTGDLEAAAKTVLVFESDLGWNGAGDAEDAFALGDRYIIGFADGHVERVDANLIQQLRWKP